MRALCNSERTILRMDSFSGVPTMKRLDGKIKRAEAMSGRSEEPHRISRFLKRLRELDWIPILIVRVSIGIFFCISGGNHLFVPEKRLQFIETITQSGIPFPELNAIFVGFVEFLFGGLLALGFLTPLCVIMLTGDMIVAIFTDRIHSIQSHTFLNWLDNFLYLPEVLYVLILIWLFFTGAGKISIDYLLLTRKEDQGKGGHDEC